MLKARQRITEILRILPGSSLMVAPADTDLADQDMAAGLEESFGGGGYTALQRAALLQMAWDHISSDLDSLRGWFDRYNELANGVLALLDIEMPTLDMTSFRIVPQGPRRPISVPTRSDASALTRSVPSTTT